MSEGKFIKTLDTFSDYNDYLNYLKYSKKYFAIKYIASNISLINKFFSSWVIMLKILGIVVILLYVGDNFLDKIFFKKLESVIFLLIFIYTYITSMSFYYIMFNDKYIIKILYILMATLFLLSMKTNEILQLVIAITFIAITIYLYTIVKTKINKSLFLDDCETSKIYIDNIAKTDEKNILKYFNDLNIFKGHKIYEVLIGWLYLPILLLPVATVGFVIYMIFFDHNLDVSIIHILYMIIVTTVVFFLMITNIFIFSFHGYISCIDEHIKSNYQR